MPDGFVHLHVHSEYSLADSVVRVPDLVAATAAAGMPAVAITDHNVAWEYSNITTSDRDIDIKGLM